MSAGADPRTEVLPQEPCAQDSAPDVSVILPYCVADAALERAKESVRAALDAAPEIKGEILAVDDSARTGVSAARNRGLARATGKWIVFVDADDMLLPDFFTRIFLPLSQDAQTDLIACGHETVRQQLSDDSNAASNGTDTRGTSSGGEGGLCGEHPDDSVSMNGLTYIEHRILCRDSHVWAKAFRSTAIEGLRFDEKMTIGEDMLFLVDFALRAGKRRCIRVTDAPGYRYTINPQGAMERPYDPSFLDEIRCWRIAQTKLQPVIRSISPYSLSLIGAIRIRAALYVAIKAARAGADEESIRAAFAEAEAEVREAKRIPGATAGLPLREKIKLFLFTRHPGKFSQLAKKV